MSIYVVSREKPDYFESDASAELVGYLGRICGEQVLAVQAWPEGTGSEDTVVCLGDVFVQAGESLPTLEENAIHVCIRRTERGRHVRLRGATTVSIRHAAYRFLEECGILFDLMDDYLPDATDKLEIKDGDIREKPLIRLHGPHLWINFPMDPSGYSREQWMRYVRGCVRLRFTVFGFHFYNNFPWFDYELNGERKQQGHFFYNHRHPLPDEPELRAAIHNRKMFVPPEAESIAEDGPALHAWAQETLRLVMAEAHRQGLMTSVTFEPFAGQDKEAQRESAYQSLKSIIEIYPQLDIVKLVSGEGHSKPGTDEELAAEVQALVGGNLVGTDGKEAQLPFGKTWWQNTSAIGVVWDTLNSAKYAYDTVLRARKAGILRPGQEVAIGGYPGCVDAIPAIFALIGKVVPDPAIKIHFLPAHGMRATAAAMEKTPRGVFEGRKLEITGWTELDGAMYYPQYCVGAIERMRDVCKGELDIDALYVCHWRVAGVTLSTAFFARCLWDADYNQDRFWGQLTRTFGEDGAAAMRVACDRLEIAGGGPAGFCYYRCWQSVVKPDDRGRLWTYFSSPNELEYIRDHQERNLEFARNAQLAATTASGRRLTGYLVNKTECALLHLEYCRLGRLLAAINDCAVTPGQLLDYEAYNLTHIARRMVEASYEYIRHYQKWMFDRGDEGMLASYYMTATRYAWRYAYPDQDDATGKFCDLSAVEAAKARAAKVVQAGDAVIHAPEMGGEEQ